MERVKNWIKQQPILFCIAQHLKRFWHWLVRLWFCLGVEARQRGWSHRRYQPLRSMQGRYAGKRCFIVCPGPSLTLEDLHQLQDEYTFAVNSVVKLLPHTPWRPTFYGIQDPVALQSLQGAIAGAGPFCVLAGNPLVRWRWRRLLPRDAIAYPLDLLGHLSPHSRWYTRFSPDAFLRVYDGYTVAYSMLQLAVYFGFTHIYLIGADCDFSGPSLYCDKAGYTTRAGTEVYRDMHQKLTAAYAEARRWATANKIVLANATRGGALEVLPRISLENVLCGNGEMRQNDGKT